MPIDMWSFGCILAELHLAWPLFPGEDEVCAGYGSMTKAMRCRRDAPPPLPPPQCDQLQRIMFVLGAPPRSVYDSCQRKSSFFDERGAPRIGPNKKHHIRRPGALVSGRRAHAERAARAAQLWLFTPVHRT